MLPDATAASEVHVGMSVKATPRGLISTSSWTSSLSGSETTPSNKTVFSSVIPPKGIKVAPTESHWPRVIGCSGGILGGFPLSVMGSGLNINGSSSDGL